MLFPIENLGHTYTLDAIGIKHFKSKEYSFRENATYDMYRYCSQHNLKIKKVYDDKHFKTYVCSDGVEFHINRLA